MSKNNFFPSNIQQNLSQNPIGNGLNRGKFNFIIYLANNITNTSNLVPNITTNPFVLANNAGGGVGGTGGNGFQPQINNVFKTNPNPPSNLQSNNQFGLNSNSTRTNNFQSGLNAYNPTNPLNNNLNTNSDFNKAVQLPLPTNPFASNNPSLNKNNFPLVSASSNIGNSSNANLMNKNLINFNNNTNSISNPNTWGHTSTIYTGSSFIPNLINVSPTSGMALPPTSPDTSILAFQGLKAKINSCQYKDENDIGNAIYYREAKFKENNDDNLKSHSITLLPEYMAFSFEELRYLNRLKRNKVPFDENSNYARMTKELKITIANRRTDPDIANCLEMNDSNKLMSWGRRTADSDTFTFQGMKLDYNNNQSTNINNLSSPYQIQPNNSINTNNNLINNLQSNSFNSSNIQPNRQPFNNPLNSLSNMTNNTVNLNNSNNNMNGVINKNEMNTMQSTGLHEFNNNFNAFNANTNNFNNTNSLNNLSVSKNIQNIIPNSNNTIINSSSNFNPFGQGVQSNTPSFQFDQNNMHSNNFQSGQQNQNNFNRSFLNSNSSNQFLMNNNNNVSSLNNNHNSMLNTNSNSNDIIYSCNNNNVNQNITSNNSHDFFPNNINNTNGNNQIYHAQNQNQNFNQMSFGQNNYQNYNNNNNNNILSQNPNYNNNFNTHQPYYDFGYLNQLQKPKIDLDSIERNFRQPLPTEFNNNEGGKHHIMERLHAERARQVIEEIKRNERPTYHKPNIRKEINLNSSQYAQVVNYPSYMTCPHQKKQMDDAIIYGKKVNLAQDFGQVPLNMRGPDYLPPQSQRINPIATNTQKLNNNYNNNINKSVFNFGPYKNNLENKKNGLSDTNNRNELRGSNNIIASINPPLRNCNNSNSNNNINMNSRVNITNSQVSSENNKNNMFMKPLINKKIHTNDNIGNNKTDSNYIFINTVKSNIKYYIHIVFEDPFHVIFNFESSNILSIARCKSKVCKDIRQVPSLGSIELELEDFWFYIDNKLPCTLDQGTINLDLLVNYTEKIKNCEPIREITFTAFFKTNLQLISKINSVLADKNSELSKAIVISMSNRVTNTQNLQSVSSNSNDNDNENDSYFPKMRKNFKIFPSMEKLKKMSEEELKNVETLTVENLNGQVFYNCKMDLTYVNLDAIQIEKGKFSISQEYGQNTFNQLNKGAFVILNNLELDNENTEEDFMRNYKAILDLCLKLNADLFEHNKKERQVKMWYRGAK